MLGWDKEFLWWSTIDFTISATIHSETVIYEVTLSATLTDILRWQAKLAKLVLIWLEYKLLKERRLV